MRSAFSRQSDVSTPRPCSSALSSFADRPSMSSGMGAGAASGIALTRNARRSASSSTEDVCCIGYCLNSIDLTIPCTSCAEICPKRKGTTGSCAPCAWKKGVWRPPSVSMLATFIFIARKPLRTKQPPSGAPCVRQANPAMAPPWLKPPTAMRAGGMPLATSSAMSLCTMSRVCMMPSSSSGASGESALMSAHAGICAPLLMVTARFGAFGKIHLTHGIFISGA
mmetsp:Transcript_39840/g.79848  ORF Transcript_39840/g.79848 Transcript_39840/m.79848 type:complete len:224 (-) Transcript_39840:300-971(-)